MKKSSIKLSVTAAFTASLLVLFSLFSCGENSENTVDIPEELTEWNAAEILGEDYKKRDTIKIPKGVARIEEKAFYRCDAQSIIIPETVTRIGDAQKWGVGVYFGVFEGCENLQSIEIPESVTYIGGEAFEGCKSLKTVTLNEGLKTLKGSTFSYCTSLKELRIPQSVTYMGSHIFYGCSSLKKVVLSENISVIEDSTFDNCTALTDITIPESVTSIGSWAFSECKNLTRITLPASLTKIDKWAFDNCSSLRTVTILAKNPPSIPDRWHAAFSGNDNNRKFYVPTDSVEAYKTQWEIYKDSIKAIR